MSEAALLESLDTQQRAAVVSAPNEHLTIIAGAGTGKTRTITTRIAYRQLVGSARAANTLAVTHSTKAAAELRHRLAALGAGNVRTSTFHSAAFRQTNHFWHLCGQEADTPVLVDTLPGKQWGFIRDAYMQVLKVPQKLVDTATVSDVVAEIGWAQTQNVAPGEYKAIAGKAGRYVMATTPEQIDAVWRMYNTLKQRRKDRKSVV